LDLHDQMSAKSSSAAVQFVGRTPTPFVDKLESRIQATDREWVPNVFTSLSRDMRQPRSEEQDLHDIIYSLAAIAPTCAYEYVYVLNE
jgi:hypothetical protein